MSSTSFDYYKIFLSPPPKQTVEEQRDAHIARLVQVMEGLFDVKFAEAENVRQVYELDKVIQGIKPHEGLDGTEQCQLWLLEHRDWIIKARSSATKSSTREPTERRNAIKNAREWLKTWNALNGKANDQPGSGKECDTPVLQRMIALLAVRLERPDGDGKLAHRQMKDSVCERFIPKA